MMSAGGDDANPIVSIQAMDTIGSSLTGLNLSLNPIGGGVGIGGERIGSINRAW